jgi:hypothetical protein
MCRDKEEDYTESFQAMEQKGSVDKTEKEHSNGLKENFL